MWGDIGIHDSMGHSAEVQTVAWQHVDVWGIRLCGLGIYRTIWARMYSSGMQGKWGYTEKCRVWGLGLFEVYTLPN